ncbi:MAG: 4-hydroxy-3-methylbut-2-enyl diphosphate reductase [Alphaproteobacteria bacterium]
MAKPALEIFLAAPRGFCAGVDRAIQIVEKVLLKYGAPVFVRHEIVHNRHVVQSLEARGAVFVDDLDEVQPGRPVIFSAHGVPKSVPDRAQAQHLFYIDATCPLVSKVHIEAQRHHGMGSEIVLIGHAGHPEVIGTMGQLPDGAVSLLETVADAINFQPRNASHLAYITQTTLSVDDTAEIISVLRRRFPGLTGPPREDICYATSNRQAAVKVIAAKCDALLVLGAPNSSNSMRLVEVAVRAGCRQALLVQSADELDFAQFEGIVTLGVTAGASAPEILVQQVLDAFALHYDTRIEEIAVTHEDIEFKLPRILVE